MQKEQQEIDLHYQNKQEIIKSSFLGFFIGLAVIVPGISGSTIAILFKLYDKLLYAIGNLVKRFRACLLFLLPIAIGVIIGLLIGFITVQQLLKILPFAIVALFAGLMLGAFPAVTDEIKNEVTTPIRIILFLLGVALPIIIGVVSIFDQTGNQSLENLNFYHYLLFFFLGYLVAITQIVPGLSATALLMAFGYFNPLIETVSFSYWQNNPQIFFVYAALGLGGLIGLVTFSKLLTSLFSKYRKTAFFLIVGLSLGSIVSMFVNPDIWVVYESWKAGHTSMPLELGIGIPLFIIGTVLSYLFVRYERKKAQNDSIESNKKAFS
ncbi:MAG TPA: DUF368 domain-containing protein [Candidatus Pelethenecus faecipullorum]|uniref:DUF368 domain-containing protein n=1 Tax=Candidatus Pelethenecus faecipullorum TaxID=2840900 RepID=A0A9D1KIW0_9MOLU|nr:DUF368 domain-containing protein [Candidatus Pelethenecus faecipullorum]